MWSTQRRLIPFVHFLFLLYAVLAHIVDIDSSLVSEHTVDVDGVTATRTSSAVVIQEVEVNDLDNDRFRFDVDYREEMHSSIRPMDHIYKANTALNAKFRSLCYVSNWYARITC